VTDFTRPESIRVVYEILLKIYGTLLALFVPIGAWLIVESWRNQLEETVIVHGEFNIKITMSAGIAVFTGYGESADQLLKHADDMLCESKLTGRNRTTIFLLI